jgi:hypothetical protein
MPMEAPGPLSDVTNPTVRSAPDPALTDKINARMLPQRRAAMIDLHNRTQPLRWIISTLRLAAVLASGRVVALPG